MDSSQYEGGIETWDGKRISGWVYCKSDPDRSLTLSILINNTHIETVSAKSYREDLLFACKGSGNHAFVSSDLNNHLDTDSNLNVIQICLPDGDITVGQPIFLYRGKEISLKCFFPWTTLNVCANGNTYPCISRAWFKEGAGVVGNQRNHSLQEIWNSTEIRRIRRNFVEGNYDICRADICPFINGEFQPKPPSPEIVSAMRFPEGEFDRGIEELVHDIDQGCNLTCVMCRAEPVRHQVSMGYKVAKEIHGMVKKGDLRELRFSPAGEVLLHKGIVHLLKSKLLSENNVHATIMTNLTTISPSLWNAIKHNNLTIQGSLDAASKATYEKIRVGAKWEDVYQNFLYLVNAFHEKELNGFSINTVVMGCNRHELGSLIELTKNLGIELFLIKHEGLSSLEENVFDCCNIDILDEIYEELEQHGAFKAPHVHLGSASILINKKYRSLHYRMTCADLQLTRYKRPDVANRIVSECIEHMRTGMLDIDQLNLKTYESLIRDVIGVIKYIAVKQEFGW